MRQLPVFIILSLITTPLLAMEPSWCSSNRLNRAERFICKKPSLWEVENRLVKVFNQVSDSLSGSKKRSLRRKQTRWLKKRNSQCRYSVKKCLRVYETRIDYLESLINENGGNFTYENRGGNKPSWCSSNRLNRAERFICSKSSLWEVENRLVKVFNQVSNSLSGSKKRNLRRKQTRWLKQRNSKCRSSVNACLRVYETRIDYLESLINKQNIGISSGRVVKKSSKNMTPLDRYSLGVFIQTFSEYVGQSAGGAYSQDRNLEKHQKDIMTQCKNIAKEKQAEYPNDSWVYQNVFKKCVNIATSHFMSSVEDVRFLDSVR